MDSTASLPRASFLRQVLTGVGYLGKGFGMWATSPRLMLLGAIPALVVGIVYLGGIVFLAFNLDSIAAWVTPFADGWTEPWQTATRFAAAIGVAVGSILLLAYTYAAVTLLVGDPFYERIWRQVETRLGNPPPDRNDGVWQSIWRAIGDGIRLLIPAVAVGIVLLICGFIPIVGQLLSLAIGAIFGGWILTQELTGLAFDARGFTLRDRRRALGRRRATSVGFGMATYLLFLVPVAAVFVMPSAVAGAAMLSRDILGDTTAPGPNPPGNSG